MHIWFLVNGSFTMVSQIHAAKVFRFACITASLIALIELVPCLSIAQQITNRGFEASNCLEGWTTNASDGTIITTDSTTFCEGSRSLKISGSSGWVRQSIPYSASAPVRLRISAKIRCDLDNGSARIVGRVLEDGKITRYDAMGTSKPSGRTGWQEYYVDIIADSSTTEVRVGAILEGNGIAYFDDFRIKEVSTVFVGENSAIQKFTDEYLGVLDKNALYRDSVDFPDIVRAARGLTRAAATVNDCLPVLTYAISKLNDGHSFLMPAADVVNWASDDRGSIEFPTCRLQDKVGYIMLPAFNSNSEKLIQAFADSLQAIIRFLDKAKVKGWVLDVRGNSGGNCWPMISGIGPLLGDGTAGYFMSRDGSVTPWSYVSGAAKHGETTITTVKKPYRMHQKSRPIAILIDEGTASSAEIVAISFVGMPNALLIGSPSYGATTSNDEFVLTDGSIIFLSTGIYANRLKQRYGGKVQPMREVISNGGEVDAVLTSAVAWVSGNGKR